jgi:putative FmdB family regulatory protein
MPIYEYQCQSCGHKFEKIQKISDDPLTDCPVCEKTELKKLISAAAFRLKGGGWYETDFKSGEKRNIAKDDASKPVKNSNKSESASSGDKSASGKTTTKAGDSGGKKAGGGSP